MLQAQPYQQVETISPVPVDEGIPVGGALLTRKGIVFSSPPSREQLKEIGRGLCILQLGLPWCWGDFFPHLLRLSQRKKSNQPPEQLSLSLVGEYATVNGYDPRALHEWEKIGRIFPRASRGNWVRFEHYSEAYYLCENNKDAAVEWVNKAEENKWSVAQMRAQIRLSKRPNDEDGEPTIDPWQVENSFIEQASCRRLRAVKSFDADRARAELDAIRNTVALVDALRQRALPHKESLSSGRLA